MTDRELDIWVGTHIAKLKGVGYYRRKSWKNTEWESCKCGDISPGEGDSPSITVGDDSLYQVICESPLRLFALPQYSTDIGSTFQAMGLLERDHGAVFHIVTMHNGKYTVSVKIRGCKCELDSFHSELGEAVDDHPSRAICRAMYNAYGLDKIRLSKLLAKILRHNPEIAGVKLDGNGWTDVKNLIHGIKFRMSKIVTMQDIEEVVATNDKKRFALEGDKIKACQGHSVENVVTYDETPQKPPTWLYHGTTLERWENIKNKGLNRMQRHDVHLSATEETATKVVRRWKKETPCILHITARKMYNNGHSFFKSENGVWLTKHVPVEYITHIMDVD